MAPGTIVVRHHDGIIIGHQTFNKEFGTIAILRAGTIINHVRGYAATHHHGDSSGIIARTGIHIKGCSCGCQHSGLRKHKLCRFFRTSGTTQFGHFHIVTTGCLILQPGRIASRDGIPKGGTCIIDKPFVGIATANTTGHINSYAAIRQSITRNRANGLCNNNFIRLGKRKAVLGEANIAGIVNKERIVIRNQTSFCDVDITITNNICSIFRSQDIRITVGSMGCASADAEVDTAISCTKTTNVGSCKIVNLYRIGLNQFQIRQFKHITIGITHTCGVKTGRQIGKSRFIS